MKKRPKWSTGRNFQENILYNGFSGIKEKIFKKTLKRKNLEDIKKETNDKFKILKKEDPQNVNQNTNNGIKLDKKTFQLKKNVQNNATQIKEDLF